MNEQAKAVRKAMLLFNFWREKHMNEKLIGELTVGDFIELCEFLEQLEEIKNESNFLENK